MTVVGIWATILVIPVVLTAAGFMWHWWAGLIALGLSIVGLAGFFLLLQRLGSH